MALQSSASYVCYVLFGNTSYPPHSEQTVQFNHKVSGKVEGKSAVKNDGNCARFVSH